MYDVYDFEFPDLSLTTYTMLRQTWIAVNRLAEAKLIKVGLTPETLAVLWLCRDYPGKLIPAEIGRMTHREPNTITGLLNRMDREGLIERTPKRKGRPFTEVKLTGKGEQLLASGLPILKSVIKQLMSGFSAKQQKQLQGLTRTLRDKALEELHLEAGPPKGIRRGEPVPVKW